MRESPRLRRLRADLRAMEKLRAESTILDFSVPGALFGGPPEAYYVRFLGKGFWRAPGSTETRLHERHEVHIHLSASYPRMMPELAWKSPIFHPNISAGGVVCLGGYSTHWVPSLTLDELCTMLWDMIRFKNFDVESPYNREAALWARSQQEFPFPIDRRPIRDRLAVRPRRPAGSSTSEAALDDVILIDDDLDDHFDDERAAEVVEAEVVVQEDQDILFLD